MKEFELINNFFRPLTNGNKASQGLADDAAKISLKKNEELIISKDLFVEDVHFKFSDGPFKIASKLLRTNISDLAACGAKPCYYLLGFSKNSRCDKVFLKEFTQGLKSVQKEFNIDLIGGDTVSSEKFTFSITVFGIVKKGKNLLRSNAKAGDLIFVSGTIGDAGIGLAIKEKRILATKSDESYFLKRHFFPTPRIELAQKLAELNLSKCAIDVSDGLLADLRQICRSSNLRAEVNLDKILINNRAEKYIKNRLDLLSYGDDYEIIFSANKKNLSKIKKLEKELKLDISCVGEFKKLNKTNQEIIIKDGLKELEIKKFGYEH